MILFEWKRFRAIFPELVAVEIEAAAVAPGGVSSLETPFVWCASCLIFAGKKSSQVLRRTSSCGWKLHL